MKDETVGEILVVTEIGDQAEVRQPERGLGEILTKGAVNPVSVSVLKNNMENFLNQLREILHPGTGRIGAFEVAQIEVSAQVAGDGKVCLMGSGVKVGVEGGVKFVLKRAND